MALNAKLIFKIIMSTEFWNVQNVNLLFELKQMPSIFGFFYLFFFLLLFIVLITFQICTS